MSVNCVCAITLKTKKRTLNSPRTVVIHTLWVLRIESCPLQEQAVLYLLSRLSSYFQ